MDSLEEFLLEKALITAGQLREARNRQAQLGGRLGTALLELGAIREEVLLTALAQQLRVPVARAEQLAGVPPKVIGLLPAALAARCEAIPFRETATEVAIAMVDVRNLTLQDELSFAVGKKLSVHVANEPRIHEALETYYGRPCAARFRGLVERLNRAPSGLVRSAAAVGGVAAPAPSPKPAAHIPPRSTARGPLRGRAHRPPQGPVSIPLSPEERAALALDARPPGTAQGAGEAISRAPKGAPEPATAVARFERSALEPESPQAVGESLADALSSIFERSIVFQIHRGRIAGWFGHVPGIEAEKLTGYQATLEERSVFREMAGDADSLFSGTLEPLPAHLRLLDLWHGAPGEECLVVPVKVRQRLVAALYGDRGARGLEGLDVDLVRRLAARAAEAFEQCIARRKGAAQ